jgi:nitrile hydratase
MSGRHSGGHHPEPEPYAVLRTKALESLLIEKGLIASDLVDRLVRTYEQDIGPLNGAKVVARAWVDPEYKRRLLENGTKAISEMGFMTSRDIEIAVLENTPKVHNMVVCTLCSCYPWSLLGLPPSWYKSAAYRSRAVIEPRSVLREFGLELDELVNLRVWDATADLRYLILPEKPQGSEHLSEGDLIPLVSRDAMIGVAKAKSPVGLS